MNNFSIGASALRTSQYALEVVSNNIANANTPGYHRRNVHQEGLLPNEYQNIRVGAGVSINYIERVRDQTAESSLTFAISDVSHVDQMLSVERQIEAMFQSGGGSISERLDSLFAEITKLTSTPSEPVQQAEVVQQAQQLTSDFHQVSNQLFELRQAVRFQIEQEVEALNVHMGTMSHLSSQISVLQVSGNPNHELDTMDQLVNEIAMVIDVARYEQVQGGSSLAFGGTSIQQGVVPIEFETTESEDGQLAVKVGHQATPAILRSGRLPALLELYNETLPAFETRLNEFASGLIQQFDQIHATGIGASGSFSLLEGSRPVVDPAVPLAESGASFPISAGNLFISVTDPDGNRQTDSLAIDPETRSLNDIAAAISGIDNLSATVNSQTNQLQIFAVPGYEFDFTGSIESVPDLGNYTGNSVPTFSGIYTGNINQQLSFEVPGDGVVGLTENLFVNVFNENGDQITRLNIGKGYEAGSEIEVLDGLHIQFPGGDIVANDTFEVTLVNEPDETGILSSLGLNSFFVGDDAATIEVDEKIVEDPSRFAKGTTSESADTTNLFNMIDLQKFRGLSEGRMTLSEYLNDISTDIGSRVRTNTQLSSSLTNLRNRYQQERDSVSAVDLNEEMVYLQEFQKAYEAAVRVIQTAESMFDELFSILR